MLDFTDDASFEEYARKAENAANKRGSAPREYEEIEWTGCEQGIPKIVRVIGAPPDSNLNNYSAKTVNISWVVGDDGKKFKLIRPSFSTDSNYIINRIISRVMATQWVNKTKVCPVQTKFPEIYNIVKRNGLSDADKQAKFDKGWVGKEVLIMNVIDRSRMDWHRENKHTMLLAKSVVEGREGGTFVDEGISAYAVNNRLGHLFISYGSWEKYDLAFIRTGQVSNPYNIINATRTPEEIPAEFRSYISSEPSLTEEERSWETYDLEKLFKVTSPIKILNRLKITIARIDAALGTSFLKDLEREVEIEKKKLEESQIQSYSSPSAEIETVTEAPVSTPPTRSRTATAATTGRVTLPFESSLGDLASHITSVKMKDDEYEIEWDLPFEQLAACPYCKAVSPLEATQCPACGQQFV